MTTLVKRPYSTLPVMDFIWQPFEDRFFGDRLLTDLVKYPTLRVEEFTEDGTYVVRAELPGVDPDKDVEVGIREGALYLRANHTEKKEDATGYRSEFRYGVFERTLPLPFGFEQSKVSATYDKGVLEIRIPVSAETATAKIPISTKPVSKK